jgi:anti-anti-sigma regulatory factor
LRLAGSGTVKRARAAKPQAELDRGRASIDVERSGDWMPAEELLAAALGAIEGGSDVTLNLGGIDHLDASALQILLALDTEQKRRGRQLEVANASPHLRKWFEYAGAAEKFIHDGAGER